MKFSVDTKAFLAAMGRIAPVIPNNPMPEVLANCRVDIHDEILTITGTDFEKTASTIVRVDADFNGSFIVDHRTFTQIVKNVLSPQLKVKVNKKSLSVELEKSNYKLPTGELDAYPTIEYDQPKYSLPVDTEAFFEALIEAKKFTNNDDLRQFYNVCIKANSEGIKLISTDAHSLYRNHLKVQDEEVEFELLLPNRCVNYFETVGFNGESVKVGATDSFLVVEDDLTKVCMRLTDAKFPAVEGVIPEESSFQSSFTCDRDTLLRAITRLGVVYEGTASKMVRFDFSKDMAIVSSDNDSYDRHGKEYVPGQFEGNDIIIGFNAKYLIRCLHCADYDDLKLNFITYKSPLIISRESSREIPKTILLMPSMIDHK